MSTDLPSTTEGPAWVIASTIMAMMVVTTMPINSPPRTRRATRMPQMTRPMTNTKVGQEEMEPPVPKPTGTVVWVESGMC